MGTGSKSKAGVRGQGSGFSKDERTTVSTPIFYITKSGYLLAQKIKTLYPDSRLIKFASSANGRSALQRIWDKGGNLIFIMATGIVVRSIAPLIKDKRTDPAVVVLDEKGGHVISLLSGHLGGANNLAGEIAKFIGGDAVITTASEVNNLPAIDMWAKENNMVIEDWKLVPKTGTKLVNEGMLKVYLDRSTDIKLPEEFIQVDKPELADIVITNKLNNSPGLSLPKRGNERQLYLRPRNLVIGIGCNRGTDAKEIEDTVKKILVENNLSFSSIHSLATIDIKKDEKGLLGFAREHGFDIRFFTKEDLNKASSMHHVKSSKAVIAATGAVAVAEPAALLSSGADKFLITKKKSANVTVAVAEKGKRTEARKSGSTKEGTSAAYELTGLRASGKLSVVGIGPGSYDHITPAAKAAIEDADVIVGYKTYVDLIQDWVRDKEVVSTAMRQEVDRCAKAIEIAQTGKNVAVICSGDPGIYAMAGLVFELLSAEAGKSASTKERSSRLSDLRAYALSVEVIPGISSLNACAARLGAPLMHDFASISLSDLLTPWALIEKRLEAAASADFVIAIYNPKSKGRKDHIKKARNIIAKHRPPKTPVGIVRGAMRKNEAVVITDLKNMLKHEIDMQSTVIIGNSQTFTWGDRMVTPRGYGNKYRFKKDV